VRKNVPYLFLVFGLGFLAATVLILSSSAWASSNPLTSHTLYFPLLSNNHPFSISGTVVDDNGPLSGATVRIKTTENKTATAPDGSFTLTGLSAGIPVSVTAWAEGYYVG
jgi:hypothetical protein